MKKLNYLFGSWTQVKKLKKGELVPETSLKCSSDPNTVSQLPNEEMEGRTSQLGWVSGKERLLWSKNHDEY